MIPETGLNLAKFDSESSDLDLVIVATKEDDISVREISR
jgi:hypothetical protein